MNRQQAELAATSLNRITESIKSGVSYMAHPIDKTRWEKERWCVAQCYGAAAYPLNVVGIARA